MSVLCQSRNDGLAIWFVSAVDLMPNAVSKLNREFVAICCWRVDPKSDAGWRIAVVNKLVQRFYTVVDALVGHVDLTIEGRCPAAGISENKIVVLR